MVYKVNKVDFLEYYSNKISKETAYKYIIEFTCNHSGKLILTMSEGRVLKQEGPVVVPPVRWLEGYEDQAEFKIVCDVVKI